MATPVVAGERVLVGVGRDPELGAAPGRLLAVDGTGRGDLPASAVLWSRGGRDFSRTVSSVTVHEGIVYAPDVAGFLHALDLETGAELWRHDTFAAVWGSALVADGRVFLGDEDGELSVLAAGREKKLLAEVPFDSAIYGTPVAKDGVLYVLTSNRLHAIGKPTGASAEGSGEP